MAVKVGNRYVEQNEFGKIEIGTVEAFKPKMKFTKWLDTPGQNSFALDLIIDESGSDMIEDGKVKWKADKREVYWYPVGDGYEFEVILKNKHAPDYIEFTIDSPNASLIIQPPMSSRVGLDGIAHGTDLIGYDAQDNPIHQQPETNLNSIVIQSISPLINLVGGPLYRTGKILHIPRMKAFNKYDEWVWCTPSIIGNKLRVTPPETFLANPDAYPIRIDPTFGYPTIGGSSFGPLLYPVCHVGASLIHTASSDRITQFSVYGTGIGCDIAAYSISGGAGGTPVNRLGAATGIDNTILT